MAEDALIAVLERIHLELLSIGDRLAAVETKVETIDARLEPIEVGMRIVNKAVEQHEPVFRELAHAAQ